jgi:hypothetical protein
MPTLSQKIRSRCFDFQKSDPSVNKCIYVKQSCGNYVVIQFQKRLINKGVRNYDTSRLEKGMLCQIVGASILGRIQRPCMPKASLMTD